MTKKIYSIDEIKMILKDILNNQPVEKVILFGSYARNTATSKSDIDFIIDSNGKLINLAFYGILEEMIEKLKKNIDLIEISEIRKNSDIYNRIKEEGIVVYEK